MNKIDESINSLKRKQVIFAEGFKAGLRHESTWTLGLIYGLWQGTKYNGNIKRGVKTSAAVVLSLSTYYGINNLVKSTIN